ncbi:MAG TPA: NUDIX hydrolase [Phenylobacterium sp.]|nr:NUDIX hydrolase [Phenylobacterium sp.]
MTGPLWPVSVKAVLREGRRVLLVRNDRDEWELPGGRLEAGEMPVDCVVRELQEETAVDIVCGDLLLAESFEVIPGRHVLIVAYACTAAAGQTVTLSEEHVDFGWFDVANLPSAELPDVYRRAILADASA